MLCRHAGLVSQPNYSPFSYVSGRARVLTRFAHVGWNGPCWPGLLAAGPLHTHTNQERPAPQKKKSGAAGLLGADLGARSAEAAAKAERSSGEHCRWLPVAASPAGRRAVGRRGVAAAALGGVAMNRGGRDFQAGKRSSEGKGGAGRREQIATVSRLDSASDYSAPARSARAPHLLYDSPPSQFGRLPPLR